MASSNHLSLSRYQQGDWFGVVRNGTVVLLGPDTPHALIDTVWELLASAPEAHEVLHEVTDAFGVSLSRIPPFGIIDSKDALRVFLRGDLELVVQMAGGEEHLTGRDVTTWTERRLADADSYSVRIGNEPSPSAGIPTSGGGLPLNGSPLNSLPLGEGVVLLASLEASARATAPADSEPEVRPAAVSDETMIGYAEADLGLTIAPGHLIPANEPSSSEPSVSEPSASEPFIAREPAVAEVQAAVEENGIAASPVPEEAAAPADQVAGEAPEQAGDAAPAQSVSPVDAELETASEADSEASEVPVHTSTTDPILPSLENTTNYDHLWDKTVMRNIEDAAVRTDEGSDDHDSPVSAAPDAPPAMEQMSPAPVNLSPTPSAEAPSGLIDSVPWLRSSSSAPEPGSDQQSVPSKPVADPAAQVPAAWSSAPAAMDADEDSDHDGQTIMKSSLPTDESGAKAVVGRAEASAVNGPSVLARMCSQGHANPPTYPLCSVCGVAVSGDAIHVPRPRLGRMRLSTGELIDLDQSLIIGRQPSVSRVQGGTMPRLVQVDSPGGDISRSHVEVRLEGWHVMLCDLKATNGTVLIREGQAPRRLAQNEMAILLDGDIAELGDNISLRFEEIL
ncbi:FHA domain-containing protein [Paenarthrobacter nitroguajacolicus]|uniref:FHA domain-containing protein n=1 Tax=Paenarthrobacter nitroguajacolicus TaxID=211146 RepID=UPI00343705AD